MISNVGTVFLVIIFKASLNKQICYNVPTCNLTPFTLYQGPKISRKGARPALISTRPFSDQFRLKESKNRDCLPPILADY